jgi:hypothetical protein
MNPDQPAHQDSCCSLSDSLLVIEYVSEQHGSWSDCADAQAGLNTCWSQTHYVGFVVTRLIYFCCIWYRADVFVGPRTRLYYFMFLAKTYVLRFGNYIYIATLSHIKQEYWSCYLRLTVLGQTNISRFPKLSKFYQSFNILHNILLNTSIK